MAKKKPVLEIVNSSGLTEADWIGINKVRGAYERGGWDAFWSELETLDDDVMLQITIIGAFFPDVIRTAIKEELAARSVRLKDLRELVKRSQGRVTVHLGSRPYLPASNRRNPAPVSASALAPAE